MKKKIFIFALIAVVFLTAIIAITLGIHNHQTLNADFTKVITCTNGVADTDDFTFPIDINSTGKYNVIIDFRPEENPGFLTGVSLISASGETLFDVTAQKLLYDTPVRLPKGRCSLKFTIIPNNEKYRSFVEGSTDEEMKKVEFMPWNGFSDGSMSIKYNLRFERSLSDMGPILAVTSIILGAALAIIITLACRKGSSGKAEYDERMLLAKYKSTSHAFFVVIIGLIIIMTLGYFEINIPIETSLRINFILLLGIGVYAVEGILRGGYYAINDNRIGYIVMFTILGLAWLGVFIYGIIKNLIIVDGILTMYVTPLLISILMISIVIATSVTMIRENREE